VVTGLATGYAVITATADSKSGSAAFTVVPPDGSSTVLRLSFDRDLDYGSVVPSDFLVGDSAPRGWAKGSLPNEGLLTVTTYGYPPVPKVTIVGSVTDAQGKQASIVCVHPL
jgi:hypothetical protein